MDHDSLYTCSICGFSDCRTCLYIVKGKFLTVQLASSSLCFRIMYTRKNQYFHFMFLNHFKLFALSESVWKKFQIKSELSAAKFYSFLLQSYLQSVLRYFFITACTNPCMYLVIRCQYFVNVHCTKLCILCNVKKEESVFTFYVSQFFKNCFFPSQSVWCGQFNPSFVKDQFCTFFNVFL